jgi:hypothetical protein
MADYARNAARAAAQIKKYGAPAVLTRKIVGDYDPSAGEVDDNGTQVFNTQAVRSEFKLHEIDGTRILSTDVLLLVSPDLATEPTTGDVIAFDGSTYKVVNSRPVKPATTNVLHRVQCRNA